MGVGEGGGRRIWGVLHHFTGHFHEILNILLDISAQAMHLAPLGDSIKVGAGCLVIEMH